MDAAQLGRCCLVPLPELQSQERWGYFGLYLCYQRPKLGSFLPVSDEAAQNQQRVAEAGFTSAVFIVCLCASPGCAELALCCSEMGPAGTACPP